MVSTARFVDESASCRKNVRSRFVMALPACQ
jgi:hypothetical protein